MRYVVLLDGTPGIVRPILPSDGSALAKALEELDPESRTRRFFFNKKQLSESELATFSHPDGTDHVAYGVAVVEDGGGAETPIAVGRFFRDREDRGLAEIAVVTADLWQRNGAGAELMRSLSAAAAALGIRRWSAAMFADNLGMKKLMECSGRLLEERDLGNGVIEVSYEIVEPAGGFFNEV